MDIASKVHKPIQNTYRTLAGGDGQDAGVMVDAAGQVVVGSTSST